MFKKALLLALACGLLTTSIPAANAAPPAGPAMAPPPWTRWDFLLGYGEAQFGGTRHIWSSTRQTRQSNLMMGAAQPVQLPPGRIGVGVATGWQYTGLDGLVHYDLAVWITPNHFVVLHG